MALCECNDTKKTTKKTCVVCGDPESRLMDPFTRKRECPVHYKEYKVFLICGECKHVCRRCSEAGWISTAGTGGGDFLYNVELNLEIVRGKTVAYDRDRGLDSSTDSEEREARKF